MFRLCPRGRAAARAGVGLLITVGGASARALGEEAVASGLPGGDVMHAETTSEAADLAARHVRAGDLVLVKGSHGIHTETVVERLVAEWA